MLQKVIQQENGQTMVEYGLILGFVAIVAIGLLINVQEPLKAFFESLTTQLMVVTTLR